MKNTLLIKSSILMIIVSSIVFIGLKMQCASDITCNSVGYGPIILIIYFVMPILVIAISSFNGYNQGISLPSILVTGVLAFLLIVIFETIGVGKVGYNESMTIFNIVYIILAAISNYIGHMISKTTNK